MKREELLVRCNELRHECAAAIEQESVQPVEEETLRVRLAWLWVTRRIVALEEKVSRKKVAS